MSSTHSFTRLLMLPLIFLLCACHPQQDIVILFDNDAHCAINGYASIAVMRDSIAKHTPNVVVVSAGDFIQGDVVGSISQGRYIVDIMNSVPYDYVTLGNHEFDYSIPQLMNLRQKLSAEMLCCNFTDLRTHEQLFAPYAIQRFGRTKVAFIGVATPTTFNTSTPTYFCDAEGNVVYTFHQEETTSLVQQAALQARKQGSKYVVVLSHLGDDTEGDNSINLIQSTYGIDAVLDGHQHHVLNMRVANAQGDSVILASTGTKFQNIGNLTITHDRVTCTLCNLGSTSAQPRLKNHTQSVIDSVGVLLQTEVQRVMAHSEVLLSDCDAFGNRLVRREETALADFVADAMRVVSGAEIGCIHGGSLRSSLPYGDITIGNIMAVLPFNNCLSMVQITGAQLLDALEVSVKSYPAENGDFHIFSGLRYTIDPTIPSSVELDEYNMFARVASTRRVVKAEVERNGCWQPIDPSAIYTLGGINYTLINGGASGMFATAHPVECDPVKDTEVLLTYLHQLGDIIPTSYSIPQHRFMVVH